MDGTGIVAVGDGSTGLGCANNAAEVLGVLAATAASLDIAAVVAGLHCAAVFCNTRNACEILTGRDAGINNTNILHNTAIQI